MNGIITEINVTKGMVAVLLETGVYSIFEILLDTNFDIGDKISWSEDYPLGDCEVKNITQDEYSEVYFQNHDISKNSLPKQLLY